MAEFLVFKADRTDADPIMNRCRYKRGDIVAVKRNNIQWGALELPPASPFVIIKAPDLGLDDIVEALLKRVLQEDEDTNRTILRRRAWFFDQTLMPALVKFDLATTGITSRPWATVRTWLRNKDTGDTL